MNWRADNGNVYYFIDRYMDVQKEIEYGDKMDDKHHTVGNYFKTREDGERMADKLRGLLDETG